MATKPYTIAYVGQTAVVTWADLDTSDDGEPIYIADFPDKTVQHTTGAGTVTIEGSNDGGTTWSTLHKLSDGSELTGLAVDAMDGIRENPALIRPVVATGTNDVVVIVASRSI